MLDAGIARGTWIGSTRLGIAMILAAALSGCAMTAQPAPTPARDPNLPLPEHQPGARYFLMVFGSDSRPPRPKLSHTWGTVVKVTDGPAGPHIDTHTISWLPETMDIRPLRFRVEPGVNVGLHETICNSLCKGEHIVMFGPYETRARFYYRFLVQKEFLERKEIGYQCVDTVGEARDGSGCACIHALTDMDPEFSRAVYPLLLFGARASRNIVQELFDRGLVVSHERHCWLANELKLDRYPIQCREYRGRIGPYQPNAAENAGR